MHPIFDHMDINNLSIIAAGSYTVVFTDGKLVMKIGVINHKQPKMIKYAHSHGFSVPMIAYAQRVIIPNQIQYMIEHETFYNNSEIMTDPDRLVSYVVGGYADVMIVGLAKPWLQHNKNYTKSSILRAYYIAKMIKINYEDTTDGKWLDAHPMNLGYYEGKLVIIDF